MERRLTTILSADVVGYSRLIREDEAGILAALKAHRRELIEPKVTQYHGRIIKLMGDGALMEFASVVEAVSFAVEVQCAMRARNAAVPEERRIEFRIGVNVGDIVVEGDDIYGDGVNIAARLEGLAEPDGICVRRNVYNQVHDKLDLTFKDLGDVEVKNIAQPIRAYKVLLDDKAKKLVTPVVPPSSRARTPRNTIAATIAVLVGLAGLAWWQPWSQPDIEAASVGRMAFPLPEKPSIAVLPFETFSEDTDQGYFADGITEDIIATISQIPGLFVVARNSTFAYKGQNVKVQKVAEDLGVRYVLEGSVRRADDRVRVTAQLIDAVRGNHVWAERFDRELTGVFEVQDQIVIKVADALHAKLASTYGDKARVRDQTASSFEAWELHTRAEFTLQTLTKENARRAQELWRQAIEIDPGYASAWGGVAWAHLAELRTGWSDDPRQTYSLAQEHAEKALSLDPTLPRPHIVLAFLSLYAKRHNDAAGEAKRAIAIDPNNAAAFYTLAEIYRYAGRFEEAVDLIQRAMRLNPHYPEWYLYVLGMAHFHLGQHEESIEAFQELLQQNPSYNWAHAGLVYNHVAAGRLEEAKAAARKEIAVNPDISLEWIQRFVPYKHEEHLTEIVQALKSAGIPE